jgi:lipid A 4'-phosphatase
MNGETPLASTANASTNVALRPWTWTSIVHRAHRNWEWSTLWIGMPFTPHWPVVIPACCLAVFTMLFRRTAVDKLLSGLFYDRTTEQWPLFFNSGCTLFYRCGIYPAFVLCVCSVILAHIGHVTRQWHLFRAGVFLVALFLIGPGLIINHGFKNNWGRPRPHQITDFGGEHAFVPVGSPGPLQQHNSSFPSGHAAVAFYLIGPAFVASPRRKGLATNLMIAGLLFGLAMSLVRVVQGGHFVSDVVWSAAIVYFTAVLLSKLILRPRGTLETVAAKPA